MNPQMMRAKQKIRFQQTCFKMKMNKKHKLNRIFSKTIRILKILKIPIIHKTQQAIPNKNLKKVQLQTI